MKSIQYMGSKKKLLDHISNIIKELPVYTVFDGFSGSVRVSEHLKKDYIVHSNDKQYFSECLAKCYLLNTRSKVYYKKFIDELNSLKGYHGWYSKHYGGVVTTSEKGDAIQSDDKKRIWQIHNAIRVDAIRDKIESYDIDDIEKSVLLTSLIEGLNKVSSVVGHQNGYLKNWSKNSYNNFVMEMPEFCVDGESHEVYRDDIFNILPHIKCDLAYYDPPYGTINKNLVVATRYTAFYHLWNTLVLNDKPDLFGKANRRLDSKKNTDDFERNKIEIILPLFERLFKETNSKYILLSYSNKSLVSKDQFEEIFNRLNYKYTFNEIEHKDNTQSTSASKDRKWVDYDENIKLKEYLILIEK